MNIIQNTNGRIRTYNASRSEGKDFWSMVMLWVFGIELVFSLMLIMYYSIDAEKDYNDPKYAVEQFDALK